MMLSAGSINDAVAVLYSALRNNLNAEDKVASDSCDFIKKKKKTQIKGIFYWKLNQNKLKQQK